MLNAMGLDTCPVVRIEVMGQDADKLRRFYAELLGWRFRMVPPMPRHYGIVEHEEGAPGVPGAVGQTGPGQPNWVTFYSQVPDLPVALSRARALGSRVLLPPVRQGAITIAVVADPEGHPVGLCAAS